MDSIRTLFEKVLKSNLVFLESEGYKLHKVETVEISKLLGPAAVATLKNHNVDRIVTFEYYQSGTLNVSIKQLHPPQWEGDDYTSTHSMVAYHKDVSSMAGSVEACLNTCIQEVNETLKGKFYPVIKGQYFRSDEIDWGGQK